MRARPFWFIGGPSDGARITVPDEEELVVCRPSSSLTGSLLGSLVTPITVREGVYERVGDLMLWRGWK